VALVATDTINTLQFQRSYEFALLHSNMQDSPENRKMHLQQMIDVWLLAREARLNRLDTLREYRQIVERSRRKATREIYFDRLRNQQTPGETEIRTAFLRSQENRLVRHLFTRERHTIERFYQELQSDPTAWNRLAAVCFRDTTLRHTGGLLGWIGWDQTDPAFEDMVYATPAGQMSAPFRSSFGWHIIRVEEIQRQLLPGQLDYEWFVHKKAKSVARFHREKHLSAYLADFMQSQQLQLNLSALRQVSAGIRDRFRHLQLGEEVRLRHLPAAEVQALQRQLEEARDEILITARDGVWTTGDFLSSLPELPVDWVLNEIDKAVAFSYRNEILDREARAAGIDRLPEVRARATASGIEWLANQQSRLLLDQIPDEHFPHFQDADAQLWTIQRWRAKKIDYLQQARSETPIRCFYENLDTLWLN